MTKTTMGVLTWGALSAALAVAPARAQVASASTAALGMADNYTAVARGLDAVAWNPAALGFPGGPSFVALTVRGTSGLGPVTLGNISQYSNALVPDGVKRDWLGRIVSQGGQNGTGGGEVTWLGLRLGRLALQALSEARALVDVSPGVAELILFGNVGEDGQATDLNLSGSDVNAVAWSTVAASLAQPFALAGGRFSLGVTVKYVVGHGLAMGENSNGLATANPVSVDLSFPLVHTAVEGGAYSMDNGHGIGVDVGASLASGGWTVSAVMQNVTSSFAWNLDQLRYRPLSVSLSQGSATTSTEDMPLASAPMEVQQHIAALAFKPVFAGGIAHSSRALTLSADARLGSANGLLTGPSRQLGAGLELRAIHWLPLRLGGALISMGPDATGWQAGAGLGLDLGPWGLNASALRRSTGRFGESTVLMFSLFSVGH